MLETSPEIGKEIIMTDYICVNCSHLVLKPINPPENCPNCTRLGVTSSMVAREEVNHKKRKPEPSDTLEIESRSGLAAGRPKRAKLAEPMHLKLSVTFGKCANAAKVNDIDTDRYIGFSVTAQLAGPRQRELLLDSFELKQYINDSYSIKKFNGKNWVIWTKDDFKKKPILDKFGKINSKGEQALEKDLTKFIDHPGWTAPKKVVKGLKFEFYEAVLYWEVWHKKQLLHQTENKIIKVTADDDGKLVYSYPKEPLSWISPLQYT